MMTTRYGQLLVRLEAYGRKAVEVLGGAPERPLVEIDSEDPELPMFRYLSEIDDVAPTPTPPLELPEE